MIFCRFIDIASIPALFDVIKSKLQKGHNDMNVFQGQHTTVTEVSRSYKRAWWN